jgi:hypothetical protein
LAVDSASFYVAGPVGEGDCSALLQCRTLADGRLVWERPLCGAACWDLRRIGEGLVCYPCSRGLGQFRVAGPWGTVQWEKDQPLVTGAGYPVVCCDAQTGRTVQQLNFECSPRLKWSRPAWGSFSVAVGWSPTPPGSTVRRMAAFRPKPAGAVLALATDIWGLVANGND